MTTGYAPAFDHEGFQQSVAASGARALDLTNRLTSARSEAAARRQEAWEARLRAKATRDQAAALREAAAERTRPRTPDARVRWFSVTGELGGRAVSARWDGGRLTCEPHLLTQARLLVDLRTIFVNNDPPARVEATLTGPPAAVMLTLARACDRVVAVDFDQKSAL